MPHRFDTSQFPLVMAGFVGDISVDDVLAYEAELLPLLNRGARFGMIFEVFNRGDVDRSTATTHAAFFKRHKALCAQRWVGLALVFSSPSLRFLLSSMMLIAPLPMPYVVVPTVEEAKRFIAKRFFEEKIPLPAALRSNA